MMVLVPNKAARTQRGKFQLYEFGGLEAKVKQANRNFQHLNTSYRISTHEVPIFSFSFINFDLKNNKREEGETK